MKKYVGTLDLEALSLHMRQKEVAASTFPTALPVALTSSPAAGTDVMSVEQPKPIIPKDKDWGDSGPIAGVLWGCSEPERAMTNTLVPRGDATKVKAAMVFRSAFFLEDRNCQENSQRDSKGILDSPKTLQEIQHLILWQNLPVPHGPPTRGDPSHWDGSAPLV